jgi:predicted unusual protein kinase regulating ubiquinone biosynthesis (AarF/ABC1/UbiB family)
LKKEKKVPTSRLSRFATLGSLVTKVAGNIVVDGAKQWSKGQPASVKSLLVQPKNIKHLADKLSQLRGAAMKVGQLLSMDAGDLLPAELSQLLDKLRSSAQPMPHKQLLAVLKNEWGDNWLDNFGHFELKSFASASIGQVHVAYLDNGEKLAIKVQYNGIADSICSDVDNVAAIIKLSGFLPKNIDINDLLAEAKLQLLAESDYKLEAKFLKDYANFICNDTFIIPEVIEEFSTKSILAMTYIEGKPIDEITHLPQVLKNEAVESLIGLFFDELFSYQLMQTDPNFANYLYQVDTHRIVLLDFGATRLIPKRISLGYLALIKASVNNDKMAMVSAAKSIGFFADDIDETYLSQVLNIFTLACEPLVHDQPYDFAKSGLAQRIKEQGLLMDTKQEQWHTPPIDAVFIHRKLAGLYLLAAKLEAKVNTHQLFSKFINNEVQFDA